MLHHAFVFLNKKTTKFLGFKQVNEFTENPDYRNMLLYGAPFQAMTTLVLISLRPNRPQ
jgi:hypothetical protein